VDKYIPHKIENEPAREGRLVKNTDVFYLPAEEESH
jgi:hypothetical protein